MALYWRHRIPDCDVLFDDFWNASLSAPPGHHKLRAKARFRWSVASWSTRTSNARKDGSLSRLMLLAYRIERLQEILYIDSSCEEGVMPHDVRYYVRKHLDSHICLAIQAESRLTGPSLTHHSEYDHFQSTWERDLPDFVPELERAIGVRINSATAQIVTRKSARENCSDVVCYILKKCLPSSCQMRCLPSIILQKLTAFRRISPESPSALISSLRSILMCGLLNNYMNCSSNVLSFDARKCIVYDLVTRFTDVDSVISLFERNRGDVLVYNCIRMYLQRIATFTPSVYSTICSAKAWYVYKQTTNLKLDQFYSFFNSVHVEAMKSCVRGRQWKYGSGVFDHIASHDRPSFDHLYAFEEMNDKMEIRLLTNTGSSNHCESYPPLTFNKLSFEKLMWRQSLSVGDESFYVHSSSSPFLEHVMQRLRCICTKRSTVSALKQCERFAIVYDACVGRRGVPGSPRVETPLFLMHPKACAKKIIMAVLQSKNQLNSVPKERQQTTFWQIIVRSLTFNELTICLSCILRREKSEQVGVQTLRGVVETLESSEYTPRTIVNPFWDVLYLCNGWNCNAIWNELWYSIGRVRKRHSSSLKRTSDGVPKAPLSFFKCPDRVEGMLTLLQRMPCNFSLPLRWLCRLGLKDSTLEHVAAFGKDVVDGVGRKERDQRLVCIQEKDLDVLADMACISRFSASMQLVHLPRDFYMKQYHAVVKRFNGRKSMHVLQRVTRLRICGYPGCSRVKNFVVSQMHNKTSRVPHLKAIGYKKVIACEGGKMVCSHSQNCMRFGLISRDLMTFNQDGLPIAGFVLIKNGKSILICPSCGTLCTGNALQCGDLTHEWQCSKCTAGAGLLKRELAILDRKVCEFCATSIRANQAHTTTTLLDDDGVMRFYTFCKKHTRNWFVQSHTGEGRFHYKNRILTRKYVFDNMFTRAPDLMNVDV